MIGEVKIPEVGLLEVALADIAWVSGSQEGGHEHDYVGNWLWDDGGCILWDDGLAIAL